MARLKAQAVFGTVLRLAIMTAVMWTAFGQVPSSKNLKVFDEIRTHKSGLAVWWMGHNGWLIKHNDTLIATDLALEDPNRREPPPLSAAELASELDLSFITHGHGDHFHRRTSRVLSQQGNCVFVLPRSCVQIARELGIPEARTRIAAPKETFEVKNVRIQPLRAIHGNRKFAVYEQANLEDCGYVITIGGRTFLQPGDSVLLEDQLFLKHVDVLFFSPTEHNTYIDRSVILINELQPNYILPQHRDTYVETPQNSFWTHGYAREVQLLLAKSLQERYRILQPGERLLIQ